MGISLGNVSDIVGTTDNANTLADQVNNSDPNQPLDNAITVGLAGLATATTAVDNFGGKASTGAQFSLHSIIVTVATGAAIHNASVMVITLTLYQMHLLLYQVLLVWLEML